MTASARVLGPVAPLAVERCAVHPLGLHDITVTDGFWARWQHLNRVVTTPHALGWLENTGAIDNLRLLRDESTSQPHRCLWFSDSDVYKVLEAVSWDLGRAASPELAAVVRDLAGVLGAAQQPDGYLNSYVQAGHEVRWGNLVMSHEFYCIGHLIQAGVAHKRATGGDELLAVVRRAADCVVRDFSDLRRSDFDGHPVIETALVELYRETGHIPYLDLAKQLIDARGHRMLDPKGQFDSAYYQDGTPVREQTVIVGHAVRALYLLSGVVDIYLETGEQALLDAAVRQWESMTAAKLYLTGAVGSRFEGESFGDEYELPPDLVYGETCATIAGIMVSWRLLLATGESRFADAIERALYNLVAASTSIERDAFFYNNPAQRRSARPSAAAEARLQRAEAPGTRPHWFNCPCCPPNIMRTIASLAGYVATRTDTGIQLHQYLPATITTPSASLVLTTRYPLDGAVAITITETGDPEWTLSLRVPDWCQGAGVAVNGTPLAVSVDARGYLRITRRWLPGDEVALTMPMLPRLTVAHPSVDAVRGAVAIERGPVVYCLESPDQPENVDLNHVELVVDEPLDEHLREDLLGQPVIVVAARGLARDDSAWDKVGWSTLDKQPATVGRHVTLTAIPYHLWANRGPSTMRVFVPARREEYTALSG